GRSGPRSERDDRAPLAAEGVRGRLLDLLVDGGHDLARGGVLAEVAGTADGDRIGGVLSDERVSVGSLDPGEAELERGVAGDLGEGLVLVRPREAVGRLLAGGDDHAAPIDDRPPRTVARG